VGLPHGGFDPARDRVMGSQTKRVFKGLVVFLSMRLSTEVKDYVHPVLSARRELQLLSLCFHPWKEFGLVKIKLLCTNQFTHLPNICAMTNTTKAESFDVIRVWESLSKSWR